MADAVPSRAGRGGFAGSINWWPLLMALAAQALLLLFFMCKIWLPPHGLFLMEIALLGSGGWLLWRLRPGREGRLRDKLWLALFGVFLLTYLQKSIPHHLALILVLVFMQLFALWLGRLYAAGLLAAAHFYFLRVFALLTRTPFDTWEWLAVETANLGAMLLTYALFRAGERTRRQAQTRLAGLAGELETLEQESEQVKDEALAEQQREEKLARLLSRRSDLLQRILGLLQFTFRPHACLLFLCDASGERLRLKDGRGETEELCDGEIACGEGIFGLIFKQGGPLRVGGLSAHFPGLVYYRRSPAVRSVLAVPLQGTGGVRGVLLLDSLKEEAFSLEDQEIAVQAAEQIEGILESASELKAYLDLQHELQQFYKASVALSRHLRLKEILQVALRSLGEIVPLDFSAVVLHDPESGRNQIKLASGEGAEELLDRTFGGREELGLCAWAIRNGVPLDYHHLEERRKQLILFNRQLPQPRGLTALTILPLAGREAPLGCLVLGTVSRPQFSREERKMAEVIANQVAISIQNGQMFAQVEKLATTDGLTGLFNHRTFQEKLEQALAFADRFGQKVALLMMDIDHFKSFNDLYGHPVGDLVLRRIAKRLAEGARKIDVAARYGGEEFALILPNADRRGALKTAERMRQRVEGETVTWEDLTLKVTLSLGVALYPDQAKAKEALIEAADKALYLAKKRGRNQVVEAAGAAAAEQESFAELLERPHRPEEFS